MAARPLPHRQVPDHAAARWRRHRRCRSTRRSTRALQHGERAVGVAALDGPGQLGDGAPVPADVAQGHHAVADRRGLRPGVGRERVAGDDAEALARAAAPMRNAVPAGPTTSPRTAPASTEASCSGSPTRMSRASGRTASSSRAIKESATIDVSSTTTTSWRRRFPAW